MWCKTFDPIWRKLEYFVPTIWDRLYDDFLNNVFMKQVRNPVICKHHQLYVMITQYKCILNIISINNKQSLWRENDKLILALDLCWA